MGRMQQKPGPPLKSTLPKERCSGPSEKRLRQAWDFHCNDAHLTRAPTGENHVR